MPTLKMKVLPKFPSRVLGGDGITIVKANGIYTISIDEDLLADITDLLAAVSAITGELRVVTAAGTVTVSTSEPGVAINKTVGAATTVNFPLAASRNGAPLIVKDMKGDALTNPITILQPGGETIDGAASDLIDFAFDVRTYRPISGVGYVKV